MSTTVTPRRSLRERKAPPAQSPGIHFSYIISPSATNFGQENAPPKGKRKRAESDTEDDDDDPKPKRKTKQSPTAKKPRKPRKQKDPEDAFNPQQAAKDSKINPDNPLFSRRICDTTLFCLS